MSFLLALGLVIGIVSGLVSIYEFTKSHKLPGSVLGILALIILGASILISVLPSTSGGAATGITPTPGTPSSSAQQKTVIPTIPTQPATQTAAATPTATPCLPTGTPGTTPISGNVDAVVTVKGCQPEEYPVSWVFGFKGAPNQGIGDTARGFMDYGNGNMGYTSELGISPVKPYAGPPLTSWLCWMNSGGFAIVLSDTPLQPTVDQLGSAALYGGYVGFSGGTYLSQTFELISSTPQPEGVQGYQFNLVVKS